MFRTPVFESVAFYNVTLTLPAELTCAQCVIQWTYTAGARNSLTVDGLDLITRRGL